MKDVTSDWQSVDSEGREIYRVFARDGQFDFSLLVVYSPGLTYTAEANGESTRGGRLLPVEKPKAWRPFRDLAEAREVMGSMPFTGDIEAGPTWVVAAWNPEECLIDGYTMEDFLKLCRWTNDPSKTGGFRCGVEE